MKNIILLITISLLWCTYSSAALKRATTEKEIIYKDIEECTKDGYWICSIEKITQLEKVFLNKGYYLSHCSYVDYKAPCSCERETSSIKKKYCEFRMKPKKIKKTRMEAADHCSNLSNRKNKEVRNEYYKSCMQDQGYR